MRRRCGGVVGHDGGLGVASATHLNISAHLKGAAAKSCMGGVSSNTTVAGCGTDGWKTSAFRAPAPIRTRSVPLGALVRDAAVRRGVEKAAQARYDDGQLSWNKWHGQHNCPKCGTDSSDNGARRPCAGEKSEHMPPRAAQ